MTSEDVVARCARLGAQVRLAEIDAERLVICRQFPELAQTNGHGPVNGTKRAMSDTQRAAVSARMKAYWKKRRKEKNAATK